MSDILYQELRDKSPRVTTALEQGINDGIPASELAHMIRAIYGNGPFSDLVEVVCLHLEQQKKSQ